MDGMHFIKEAAKYARTYQKEGKTPDIRIAVLGSASIQHFVMALRYALSREELHVDIYEGGYDGIAMDVFDVESPLYRFKPEIVILLTHYLDVRQFPEVLEEAEETKKRLEHATSYYETIWGFLKQIPGCHVLQSNFVIPPEHVLGNLETQCGYSRTVFYRDINTWLAGRSPAFVTIVDLELTAGYIGKYRWFDYPAWFLNKSGISLSCIEEAAWAFAKQILAIRGRIRKCLVLDLDHTLWGGVVGEEGSRGIELGPESPLGEAYQYFQKYLLELKAKGVLLAVCSKNDEGTAKAPFQENPNMILKLEDISCFVANWEDKASNLRKIASELNIGTDSLAFFDDNPAEREIVRRFLPEVHVIDVPEDPALYALQLDREAVFEWRQITEEDRLRSDSYLRNRQREEMELQYVNYGEYLKALEMKGSVERLSEKEAGRFVQLLNKSNQFNVRTKRYTEEEIGSLCSDENARCLYAALSDRFSRYGLISCVILRKQGGICFIESWVMSCRVLKRNVEQFIFSEIIHTAKEMGCHTIEGEYIPTSKNKLVAGLYDSLGFALAGEDSGIRQYSYHVEDKFVFENYIGRE